MCICVMRDAHLGWLGKAVYAGGLLLISKETNPLVMFTCHVNYIALVLVLVNNNNGIAHKEESCVDTARVDSMRYIQKEVKDNIIKGILCIRKKAIAVKAHYQNAEDSENSVTSDLTVQLHNDLI